MAALGLKPDLGLTHTRINDIENEPKSSVGRNWYDIKKAFRDDLGFGNGVSAELF